MNLPEFKETWQRYEEPVKGQLISKEIFVSSILQNNELENLNICPGILEQNFFDCILEELKTPKCPFEIIWPLKKII